MRMCDLVEATKNIVRKSDDYWIKHFTCMNNAYYNTYQLGNQKTHKVRGGGVWFKGKQLFGGDMSITNRKFERSDSHWWVETKDGKIIDWVINEYLEEPDLKKVVWVKSEIEALGFEYRYYEHEVNIEKKMRKQFGKCGEIDRKCFGEWSGTHQPYERKREEERKRSIELYTKYVDALPDDKKKRTNWKYGDGLPVMAELKDGKWVDIDRCSFK
jgi:hypothetical protein